MLSLRLKSASCLRRLNVCSGMFPLIWSCLKWELMLDKDYGGKTVLMHAASSGRAAVFKELFIVMNEHIEDKKVSQHLTRCRDTIYRSTFLCCTSRFVYMSSYYSGKDSIFLSAGLYRMINRDGFRHRGT